MLSGKQLHVLYIYLLYLSQNWPTKKMAAISIMSLNKSGVLRFPQKRLFTLRMIKVFIDVWMKLVALSPNVPWSRNKGRHERKICQNLQSNFELNSQLLCSHAPTGTVTDGNMELGKGNIDFVTVSNFPRNNYLPLTLTSKKIPLLFKYLIWVFPNFYKQWEKPYST